MDALGIIDKYYRVAEVGVVPQSVTDDVVKILQEYYAKEEAQQEQQTQQNEYES